MTVLTEPKDVLVHHTVFHCVSVVYLLGWRLSVDTAGHVNFLEVSTPSPFHCLSENILLKRVAPQPLLVCRQFIKCLSLMVKPLFTNVWIWRQNHVTSSNEYWTSMSMECLIHLKHSLKILCKSKHFPGRYTRKREWVFFPEHSVYCQPGRKLFSHVAWPCLPCCSAATVCLFLCLI